MAAKTEDKKQSSILVDRDKEKVYSFHLIETIKPANPGDPPYRPLLSLRNPCLVFDSETGRQRRIRYLRGEKSIWEDEQNIDKSVVPRLLETELFRFIRGSLALKTPMDALAVEFLLRHDDYEGNPNRLSTRPPKFKLLNPEVLEKNDSDLLDKQEKAMRYAKEADEEMMLAHAERLGIPFYHDITKEKRSPDSIRVDYRKFAAQRPVVFLDSYKDPTTILKYKIKGAIQKNKIDVSRKSEARYRDTSALITNLDPTKDAIEQLADFALSPKGVEFKNSL